MRRQYFHKQAFPVTVFFCGIIGRAALVLSEKGVTSLADFHPELFIDVFGGFHCNFIIMIESVDSL